MLLNDFLTVAFIPALIQPNLSEVQPPTSRDIGSRALLNSRRLPLPQSSEETDIFGNDEFFNRANTFSPSQNAPLPLLQNERQYATPRQQFTSDPILKTIYEEEKRLNLQADDGGDFDDMRSEEARELINFQRRKVNMMQNFARQASAIAGIPQGRSLFFGPGNKRDRDHVRTSSPTPVTEYPILIPVSSPRPNDEVGESVDYGDATSTTTTTTTTTTVKPSGRFGIGGVFNKVTTGVGGIFTNIHNKIRGTSPPSTSSPTPPPPNSVYFPDEDENENGKPSRRPPQQGGSGSGSVVFEDPEEIKPTEPAEPLNCTGFKTEYNGACYNVLQRLPCPAGQWLIEDDTTGKGKCVENKCDNQPNTAFFAGKCVTVRAEGDHCHKGMIPYIFKNGEIECDCKELYLFNQRDGNCYPAYHRGPCNPGEIFVTRITEQGARPPSCIRSKCSKDGYFCNAPSCPKDRNCVELKSKCATGVWDIHPEKLAPACIDFNVYKPDKIIGNVPTLACAPGSRRDILGTCRKPSKITFS